MPALLVTCACPDAATAEAVARTLVEANLAACVQVLPGMRSFYRWDGALATEDEVLLLAKTWDDRLGALTEAVRAAHPYALPEIMAVPAVGGLAAYLDWVHAGTRPPGVDEIVE